MSRLTPICVACRLAMRCVKNDRLVRDPEAACGPSTYWLGDEYECPDCEHRIVTGFGEPIGLAPVSMPGEVLQFDYERQAGPTWMFHLDLKPGPGEAHGVTGWMALQFPSGATVSGLAVGPAVKVPLLAFGDVHNPIALLSCSLVPAGDEASPCVVAGVGTRVGADRDDLWAALAEGGLEASVQLRVTKPARGELEIVAISLELAGGQRE